MGDTLPGMGVQRGYTSFLASSNVEYTMLENISEIIQTDPRAERVILEAPAVVEHAAEAEAETGARGRKQRTVTQIVLDER